MGLVSKTIPGFYNGISQQAAPLRAPTQCEDQVNCYSNLVDGLTKRPNTTHLAKLTSNAAVGCMLHEINYNINDQYAMVITGDVDEPVEIFRLDTGVKCTIIYGVYSSSDTDVINCTASIYDATTLVAIAHPFYNGLQIYLSGDLPAELDSDVQYYVVNSTVNAFKVALTLGGAAIEFTYNNNLLAASVGFREDDGVKGYFHQLDSLEPNEVFKAITLADTTFILNKNIVPIMNGNTKDGEIAGRVQTITDLPTGAGIPAADTSNVIAGNLSYQTQLDGDEAGAWVTFTNLLSAGHMTFKMYWEYLTRSETEGATRLEFQWVTTAAGWTTPAIEYAWFFGNTYVAHNLYYRLPIGVGNWDIRVRRIGSTDHELPGGVEHDNYGTYHDCNWQGCQLKAWSTGADIYEITGAADSSSKSFYLQNDGEVWLETLKPGLQNEINPSSMPHILQLKAENRFTFSTGTWGTREVGDNDTTPLPSFIDNVVDNITFFKDRFGLLSQENIVLSRLGTEKFYNFFPASSIDVIDDDPIDIAATSGDVTPLRSSMVYDEDLILFSDQKQFALSSGDKALTPTSVAITPTTNYAICSKCEPTGAGANVYFVSPKLDFVSLREYMILPDSLVTDAADITAHVPSYIPNGDLIILKALNAFDCLFVWSSAEPETIFVYKFYWLGNEKPQASWSKWTFDGDVLGLATMDSYLTILIERENGELCLEKIHLEREETGNVIDWRIHLDRRELLLGVYNGGTDLTTWTSSYDLMTYVSDVPLADAGFTMVDEETGLSIPGVTITSETTMTRSGDWSDMSYYIGKAYTSSFQPTPWYIRDSKDNVIVEGRIQVRTLTLSFTRTAYFTVSVMAKSRSALVHEFVSNYVGGSLVDDMMLITGEKSFPIFASAKDTTIEIASDSYLPMQFSVGSWRGSYHPKAKVI